MVSRALVNDRDYTIWIDSIDRPMLIQARRNGKIKCLCSKPLTYVDAAVRIPHFRHLRGNCLVIGAERDTETHNDGVEYIGQLLRENLRGVATVEKEKTFAAPDGLRRTDIFAASNDGSTICYELQCSQISEADLSSRESAYKSLGHQIIWLFGPECSGIKYPPLANDLLKGVSIPLKSVVFNSLLDTGYLVLYFPESRDRLRIAYCSDGRFDRTRRVTVRRGKDSEFEVSMPEVQLAAFTLEFSEGLPYMSRFSDLVAKLESNQQLSLARAIYGREFARIGIRTGAKVLQTRKSKGGRKNTSRLGGKKGGRRLTPSGGGIFCSLCKSRISTQHYHKCPECGSILDDTCTFMIENDLGQSGHNMTGWVEHCTWKRLRSSKS